MLPFLGEEKRKTPGTWSLEGQMFGSIIPCASLGGQGETAAAGPLLRALYSI